MSMSRDRTGLTPDKLPNWFEDPVRVPEGSIPVTAKVGPGDGEIGPARGGIGNLVIGNATVGRPFVGGGLVSDVPPPVRAPILVYGAGHVGIEAAIAAAEEGFSVVLVEPTTHIGGEVTSGIAFSDFRASIQLRTACNRLTREFFRRASDLAGEDLFTASYSNSGAWNYPCALFYRVFKDMLADYGVTVYLGWRVKQTGGALMSNAQCVNVTLEKASDPTQTVTVAAQRYINGNPEPDLGVAMGISYATGREAVSANEPDAGTTIAKMTFTGIDPYVTPGVPASGLLPGVLSDAFPAAGSADPNTMWSCYRMVVTDDPAKQIPFKLDGDWDPSSFSLHERWFQQGTSSPTTFPQIVTQYQIANVANQVGASYSIKNWNNALIGFNKVGGFQGRLAKTYAQRDADDTALWRYTRGLVNFLRNNQYVPLAIRNEAAKWGLLAGEPYGSDGRPPLAYHRAIARMSSASAVYFMDQRNVMGTRVAPNPIAFGSYKGDGHFCSARLSGGVIVTEGNVDITPPERYGIDLGCLLPKPEICNNYIEAFAIGCSYVAWCSLRVAPTLMSVGEVAGKLAAWSLKTGRAMHEATAKDLWDKVGYSGFRDVPYVFPTTSANIASGVVTTTTTYGDYETSGKWDWRAGPLGGASGNGGWLTSASGTGTGKYFKAIPNITALGGAGLYEIYVTCPEQHSADKDDILSLPIQVVANGATTNITLDLRNGEFVHRKIGEFRFSGAGGGAEYVVAPNIDFTNGRSPAAHFGFKRIAA